MEKKIKKIPPLVFINITSTSVTMVWQKIKKADHGYFIWFAIKPIRPGVETSPRWMIPTADTTHLDLTLLNPGQQYFYWIVPVDENWKQLTEYIQTGSFTTLT